MNLAQLLQWNISLFIVIFARWAGMVMLAPVFGARGVPTAIKLALTASFSIIMYPIISNSQPNLPVDLFPYIGVLIKEILLGLTIGFVIYTFTAILTGAGQLIDMQMGFMMGNMIDPVYGMQGPLMGNFQIILATMILLATNSHHLLVAAMVKSYTYVPINPVGIQITSDFCIVLARSIFALSIQLALPVFGAIIIADIGMGILSRTVPQMNIFSVIFPIKIIFGFIILIFAVPFFGESVVSFFNKTMQMLLNLYQGWRA